ncbi:hypothetical protein [Pseudoalteromonas luteoviolacea]|uniref:Uncharacterized protein n=1 Tax=Pseudoalteromonas luteoviolacea S4054 TaxID=1129367 RepID=A0A0F6AD27_9GAMM|nr:hypothetical protein [Pseudoalteromonas luteoviolacea]AOT09844.1 hypothetical protein S4054249_19325 [Pseudoalteromonas luteoviolacea]AOT14756.1 hypothetical protein S40542_19295 [Pseudoalteromonas luteoviolacea]AOT19671.1 hypothetical protein S4054_19300 [Pseudoalteromonas luteoviolacea]KKE84117.1 hypothetical protein N479_11950 [Pseudoalteromonas luteoviolacea S4054]KZN77511.1 hypothetical protein N481_05490 [Pseudoalteromonas luteoviolacea S4047-1]
MQLFQTTLKVIIFSALVCLLTVNILPTTYRLTVSTPISNAGSNTSEFLLSTSSWVQAISVLESSKIQLITMQNAEKVGGFVAFNHSGGRVDATLVEKKPHELQYHLRFHEEHQARMRIHIKPATQHITIVVQGEVLSPLIGSLNALLTKYYLEKIIQTAVNEMNSKLQLQSTGQSDK